MIVSVRESKARLSKLVSKANAGEEVVITVRENPAHVSFRCNRNKKCRIAARCYRSTEPVFLRTPDGIHLATAQRTKSQTIISIDERMNAAARMLGMRCITD